MFPIPSIVATGKCAYFSAVAIEVLNVFDSYEKSGMVNSLAALNVRVSRFVGTRAQTELKCAPSNLAMMNKHVSRASRFLMWSLWTR